MSTMSTDIQRRRRLRGAATYGVMLVTIALVVIAVQVVGHEAGHLFSKVSQALAH
jgi:Flp pilus assembly pilin Flp